MLNAPSVTILAIACMLAGLRALATQGTPVGAVHAREPVELKLPESWANVECYRWLADGKMIVRYNTGKEAQSHTGEYAPWSGSWRPLPWLDAASTPLSDSEDNLFEASPDSTMLLFYSNGNQIVSGLDGQKRVTSAYPVDRSWWAPDSNSWVGMRAVPGTGATELALDSVAPERADGNAPRRWYDLGRHYLVAGMVTSTEVLVVSEAVQSVQNGWASVKSFDLAKYRSSRRQWRMSVPDLTTVKDAKVSPDGRRLCWLLVLNSQRLNVRGSRDFPGNVEIGFWVSGTDGIGLHRLWSYDLKPDRVDLLDHGWYRMGGPSGVQWLPDSSRISFRWNHKQWTLDAK